MWIIEDMFKSRKGFELKNSLTEYIPDTYFEYGEWDKFLFERDNLRLIKAAEGKPGDIHEEPGGI